MEFSQEVDLSAVRPPAHRPHASHSPQMFQLQAEGVSERPIEPDYDFTLQKEKDMKGSLSYKFVRFYIRVVRGTLWARKAFKHERSTCFGLKLAPT